MIRLAFSTNAFKKQSLAEAIDTIAAIGYRGVEIMADVPHAHPASFDAAARRALKQQLAARGLQVSNINAFTHFADGDTYHPTWIEDDPALREVRIRHTLGAIELAAELEARSVSIQPGGPLIGTGLSREQAEERFAEGLNRIEDHAQKYDIAIAIEPEPGLLIESASEYLEFKNRYFRTEPSVQMNCDIGHLFCVGEDPAEVIRAIPDDIAHVHLEDIGANRVHQHLAPGKGVIDFRAIFAALEQIFYTGWVTVELYPYETTAAEVARIAWQYLTGILQEARFDSGCEGVSPGHP
ncbi:sugar phosphate isomerase/epimerase family protein [Fontivita pretiosa]|uniref:sugar phosphate isomerase/epimerase family protein n=1 Tax=Fontivita pretiosa TaxID=2989684 RepID=UPI003D178494